MLFMFLGGWSPEELKDTKLTGTCGDSARLPLSEAEEGPLGKLLSSRAWLSVSWIGVGWLIGQNLLFTGSWLFALPAPESEPWPGKSQLPLALYEIKQLTLHHDEISTSAPPPLGRHYCA